MVTRRVGGARAFALLSALTFSTSHSLCYQLVSLPPFAFEVTQTKAEFKMNPNLSAFNSARISSPNWFIYSRISRHHFQFLGKLILLYQSWSRNSV